MSSIDPEDTAGGTSSESDLSRRLERLGAELEARRPAGKPQLGTKSSAPSDSSSMGRAFRASTEFVAGVIAGGGLGWLIDKGLGSKPWGMIICLLLGFAAGIYNVMRSSGFLTPPPGVDGSGRRRD